MFQMEHSLSSSKLRVVSMFEAMVSSPDDVVVDDESMFRADLRVFSTNDAKVSSKLRVFRFHQAMFSMDL
jgi:hypothetical protein